MPDEIILRPAGALVAPALTREEQEQLRRLWEQSRAASTVRAYKADWGEWESWCLQTGNQALPAHPVAVALYLNERSQSGIKPPTLAKKVAAIGWVHRGVNLPSPTDAAPVKLALAAIRRIHGTRPRRVAAIDLDLLRRMLATLPDNLKGTRDRAILLVEMLGAFRVSEATALRLEQLEFRPDALIVHLGKTKTDQEGVGADVALAAWPAEPGLCPLTALRRWLDAAGIVTGYVFPSFIGRSTRFRDGHITTDAVRDIVKAAVAGAGLDPAKYSSHSLRAGFITQALRNGATFPEVAAQSRHTEFRTMMLYKREADPLEGSAALKVHGATPGQVGLHELVGGEAFPEAARMLQAGELVLERVPAAQVTGVADAGALIEALARGQVVYICPRAGVAFTARRTP